MIRCPVCGSKNSERITLMSARDVAVEIMKCQNCVTKFAVDHTGKKLDWEFRNG